jgi:hypothetical protein
MLVLCMWSWWKLLEGIQWCIIVHAWFA